MPNEIYVSRRKQYIKDSVNDLKLSSNNNDLFLIDDLGNKIGKGVSLPIMSKKSIIDKIKDDFEYINVLNYGVKNDGETDNSGILLKLINNGYKNLYFPNGIYKFTLSINKSGISFRGQSIANTIFVPSSNTFCLELNSVNENINNNLFSNFTLRNNSNFSSVNAISFIGEKENDRHVFNNIIIQNGFKYGISMEGRCIWSIFENFWIENCYSGLSINGNGAKNLLTFNNIHIRNSQTNAIFLDGGNAETFKTISFNNCNFENNCRNIDISIQYAVKLLDFDEISFNNCYIENNSNKTSQTYAIYCGGTYNRCLNIVNSLIWGQEYGVCIEGTIMSGAISGNRIINTNEDIIIGTEKNAGGGHEESAFSLLGNTLSHPLKKNQDINMNNSVTTLNPLSLAYRHANNNPTPDVRNCNVIMSWTSESITNFLNGTNGQVIIVYVYGNANKVFSNNTYIQLRDSSEVTISKGESIGFMFFNDKWIEIFRNTK